MFQKTNFQSKFFDGPVSALLIILLAVVMIGLISVSKVAGDAGVLIYLGIIIFTFGICLRRLLSENLSKILRAWYGIVGGMAAWTALELGEILGLAKAGGIKSLPLLVLIVIFTLIFWKELSVGSRFFLFIFLLNWGGHAVIRVQEYLANFSSVFETTLTFHSWAALLLAAVIIFWIFKKSESRIERLYAAGWLYLFIFTFIHMLFFY